MRALRVVGVHEDGQSIVLEDPARHEQFTVPADDRLRAAARGDITRLGQIEIETENQVRPREIQARIRAGETVQQVAASAGVPESRVERFAYPVLLERSRTADMAQAAHPIRDDGPDVQTLGEVVAHSFGLRNQDYTATEWDAWKGDDRKWVVALRWRVGHSEMAAHWQFAPGAHGGTVTALDEQAEDLLDPNRAPRTLRAISPEPLFPVRKRTSRPEPMPAPEPEPEESAAESTVAQPVARAKAEPERKPEERPALTRSERAAQAAARMQEALMGPPRGSGGAARTTGATRTTGTRTGAAAAAADTSAEQKPKSRRGHPVVPAWEDVLLGVRSQRG